MWKRSELRGMFGSQYEASSELINGHRNDESCMAASMYLNKHEPTDAYKVRYCIEAITYTFEKVTSSNMDYKIETIAEHSCIPQLFYALPWRC